jgi:hypothetical protein
MLQDVLKSDVWHNNKPKSQLCGPTSSAQSILHETFIFSHLTMQQLKTDALAVGTILTAELKNPCR